MIADLEEAKPIHQLINTAKLLQDYQVYMLKKAHLERDDPAQIPLYRNQEYQKSMDGSLRLGDIYFVGKRCPFLKHYTECMVTRLIL